MSRRLLLTFLIVVIALQLLRTLPVRSEPAPPSRPSRICCNKMARRGWRNCRMPPRSPWRFPLPGDAAPALADVNSWSRIVFQSARGNNYNIFTMLGPGTPEHIVMVTGAYELYPRYNRGATAIAYASNRAGNYDIWTMPPDGRTQTQLTSSTATDTDPSWSPDGSKIIFTSYRGGAAQVYVMNANGSNQHALTTDPNYYSGQAAWSPDGSKIAYVSTWGGTNGRVWLMNADGSGQHVLSDRTTPASRVVAGRQHNRLRHRRRQRRLAGNLVDDSRWRRPTSGLQVQRLWQHSPTPGRVAGRLTAVTLPSPPLPTSTYQGQWYWMWAHCDAIDLSQSYNNTIRVTSGEQDFYSDWQTADVWPPTSHVNALPAQSPGPFTVTWGGTDSGPAGLWSYDVQFKAGANSSWLNWQMGTGDTSASFPGEGGVVYYFRCRARDYTGNQEAWPPEAQASTTVENLPPVMTMNPLPAYSQIEVLVTWSGYDPGGSGIKSYDLQVREEGGDWVGYPSGDYRTLFSGDMGKTYHFRVRGTDNANNVGEWTRMMHQPQRRSICRWWPEPFMTRATCPISDTTVASWPPPVAPVSTTIDGHYVDYLKYGDPTTAMTVTHPGYQTPPSIVAPKYEGLICGSRFGAAG